jgi:hypothetical protein
VWVLLSGPLSYRKSEVPNPRLRPGLVESVIQAHTGAQPPPVGCAEYAATDWCSTPATMECEQLPLSDPLALVNVDAYCGTPEQEHPLPPWATDSMGEGSSLSSSTTPGGYGGVDSLLEAPRHPTTFFPVRAPLEDRGGYLMRVLASLVADGSLQVRHTLSACTESAWATVYTLPAACLPPSSHCVSHCVSLTISPTVSHRLSHRLSYCVSHCVSLTVALTTCARWALLRTVGYACSDSFAAAESSSGLVRHTPHATCGGPSRRSGTWRTRPSSPRRTT